MVVGERRLRSARPSDAPGPVAWWQREVAMNVAYRWGMAIIIGLAVVAAILLVVGSVRADVVPVPGARTIIVPPAREAFPGRVAEYYAAFARHDFVATWHLRWSDLRSSRGVGPYAQELEELFTGVAVTVGPPLTWFETVGSRAELVGFAGVWLEFRWPNGRTWRTCHVTAWVWERGWLLGPEHWYFHMGEFSAGGRCAGQTKSPGWPAPSRFSHVLTTPPPAEAAL